MQDCCVYLALNRRTRIKIKTKKIDYSKSMLLMICLNQRQIDLNADFAIDLSADRWSTVLLFLRRILFFDPTLNTEY